MNKNMNTPEMLEDLMDFHGAIPQGEEVLTLPQQQQQQQGKVDQQNGGTDNVARPPPPPPTTPMILDCYPYTFSPLLLFSGNAYFDKGHSNYNAVESFFRQGGVLPGDGMKNKVLFERKNMIYEELLEYVVGEQLLVTCCIDDHFTAFKFLTLPNGKPGLVYYDPLSPAVKLVQEKNTYQQLAIFLLLKCNYGDSQHIQDNRGHYKPSNIDLSVSTETRTLRKMIYKIWDKINSLDSIKDLHIKMTNIPLCLKTYLFINDPGDSTKMSTQLTGNTCYFQVFLFACLCIVGDVRIELGERSGDINQAHLAVQNQEQLQRTTVGMAQFLLQFFVTPTGTLRPLTNSNILLDFYRYEQSPYYKRFVNYLSQQMHAGSIGIEYQVQYNAVLKYYMETQTLHLYSQLTSEGPMSSTPNTKQLQFVTHADEEGAFKLGGADYFKYRAANLMFGCNAAILQHFDSFCEFNAWRKNQLLRYMREDGDNNLEEAAGNNGKGVNSIIPCVSNILPLLQSIPKGTKYRDYYFMPQFEIGQRQLIDLHYYTFLLDSYSRNNCDDADLVARIHGVNHVLFQDALFSTNKHYDYEKIMPAADFKSKCKKHYRHFLDSFGTIDFFSSFVGLGFSELNPNEKDFNSLTQTVFYTKQLAGEQSNRRSAEFEKECINSMARNNLRKVLRKVDCQEAESNIYNISIRIGQGFTYSKYSTLMHFLNVVENYWNNPDIANVQLFGKDIRVLLVLSSQKIAFGAHGFYYYGPTLSSKPAFRGADEMDLAVSQFKGDVNPSVADKGRTKFVEVVLADRVFEYSHVKSILERLFKRTQGKQLKSDNEVLNLCLLSLMLDFGLYQKYCHLLNLSVLNGLQHMGNQQELQVECANWIFEFDRRNTVDQVKRSEVEDLLFETSYKFLVNKDFNIWSGQFKLIRILNSDPDYQKYVLLVKIYMSLCQINKSVEVDYYKVTCDGEFRIIIPEKYRKATGDFFINVTKRYTFSEKGGIMIYDEHELFDLTPQQPDIQLFKVRLDSSTAVSSMVKYIQMSHAFKVLGEKEQYLVFMADNVMLLEVDDNTHSASITINKVAVQIATVFFNIAISFIPCFKYDESDDVVLFTSRNIHYMVDKGGQFCSDYYGMREELLDNITSQEVFVDLNDDHVFKEEKLSHLLTESKTVLYYPDYLLQVSDRQHLINLLDFAVKIRNVSFFIYVLFYLRRASVHLDFIEREGKKVNIAGPWRAAILYVLFGNSAACYSSHYDEIFEKQFFDLNQHKNTSLDGFIEILSDNFCKYQRFVDGEYQIVPRPKQKSFLKNIIRAEECFHFSEVGSGKTKVILPLLCQIFLSNNVEAHEYLARGGKQKHTLIVLVPEHLLSDARTQVYRYCLNLNFRQDYRVYHDIFVLLHKSMTFDDGAKKIFVTSFNQFKKALTYDVICRKIRPHREYILVVADEIDDFLDRDKLVFNICSNMNSAFNRPTLDLFFEMSRAIYNGEEPPDRLLEKASNAEYWKQLYLKFRAVHNEIQDASRSLNKSFGIFNAYTLRHCTTNITHDIEGYKALIARPYESVNRAMAGSYYSDVERTIFLTYVCIKEDIKKYDELFQAERKYISFEYWSEHFLRHLEYDDLVYGHEKLSQIYEQHPGVQDGLTRFLYDIILRRMEIRDESRSVNSIDVIFNFDSIGFTGTPFLDNYPTFKYIREKREDGIPDLIDRSFYVYSSEGTSQDVFEQRFARFQGNNNHVEVKYVSSEFIRQSTDEMATLETLFDREEQGSQFNGIVDLCGVFKRSTIHDVRNLIRKKYGADRFRYVYHIDQADNSDRVLYMDSDNDVLYDEEFYRYLTNQHGANLRDRIFFFIDNRNTIGKDIPFQLVYQRHFGQPLLTKAVVLAHDVDDFSKIWQAMGRSRTMNETVFSIYKSGMGDQMDHDDKPAQDIKGQDLTRELYIRNCDSKMTGNISSMFLTVVALQNISLGSFYYNDTIVNVFLEKMQGTITKKVAALFQQLQRSICQSSLLSLILFHIIADKYSRSNDPALQSFKRGQLGTLLGEIVSQKFEQRTLSNDEFDSYIAFLSGDQEGSMEISYTKQQQKQKEKQQNKNQDSDAMGIFDKKNQLVVTFETDDYFEYVRNPTTDATKLAFNLPSPVPITTVQYAHNGAQRTIQVYPTLQFLYSHHIQPAYITSDVHDFYALPSWEGNLARRAYRGFWKQAMEEPTKAMDEEHQECRKIMFAVDDPIHNLQIRLIKNGIRQSPQYTLAGLKEGVYVIGMKDQFNAHDLPNHQLAEQVQFVMDEVGFVLYDKTKTKSLEAFGPYFLENYILLDILSKQEVARNVLDFYCNHRETLEHGLKSYDETQGKGFVSWRFLMNEAKKAAAAKSRGTEKRKRED